MIKQTALLTLARFYLGKKFRKFYHAEVKRVNDRLRVYEGIKTKPNTVNSFISTFLGLIDAKDWQELDVR